MNDLGQYIAAALGGSLGLGVFWRGVLFLFANLDQRNQKLTTELIQAKTAGLQLKIDLLTNELKTAQDVLIELQAASKQLRIDLDQERQARQAEAERAAQAESVASALTAHLEREQLINQTLFKVLSTLRVSVPAEHIKTLAEGDTDDVTIAADKVVSEITTESTMDESGTGETPAA